MTIHYNKKDGKNMSTVRRVYVGKKPAFRTDAAGLLRDLQDNLHLKELESVRMLHRY